MEKDSMTRRVKTGLEILAEENWARISGSRVGVLSNHTALNQRCEHLVDLLHKSPSVNLARIFAPEHGFRAEAQDMIPVNNQTDSVTGTPVVSLYGSTTESLRPRPDQLEDLDIILVDLQDVGSRYYTFAQTLAYLMIVAKETNTEVYVLDRPNPIGGDQVEGAALKLSCRSFCGEAPVPNRHGLTLGELANVYNRGFGRGKDAWPEIGARLSVVPAQDWARSDYWEDTGLNWNYPSPNMPRIETAVVYPGMCLFEATNISEGRGTTLPFELLGAPYINGAKWISATLDEGVELPGVILRPAQFIPQFHKWAGKTCGGIQILVTDRNCFEPLRLGLCLLSAAFKLYPDFAWRSGAYEFVDNVPAIDLLYGSPQLRESLDRGETAATLTPEILSFEKDYIARREPFLLY